MILKKREIQNYTPDEVSDHLRAALELVAYFEPAEDLRVPLFNQAVGLLSGKQIMVEQAAPTFAPPILGGNGLR
jgi:hypothetical protein